MSRALPLQPLPLHALSPATPSPHAPSPASPLSCTPFPCRPFTFLTIYNVIRNQYFYLGETVLYEVPSAANFVVATFIIVEMADEGNEGMVYGLLTTTANLGEPFGNAISNQLFGLFRPALSDSANYIEDSSRFRQVVAYAQG